MNLKLIAALVLISLFILLVIGNTGTMVLDLYLTQAKGPKPLLLFFIFATGLVTGVLLKNK